MHQRWRVCRICCALYKSRGGLIDRRTHYHSRYPCILEAVRNAARTGDGPACTCTHVVSNRYRGYRQTSGEINAHARTTYRATRRRLPHGRTRGCARVRTRTCVPRYRIYFGASTSRPRICGDGISIALREFRDARGRIRGVPLSLSLSFSLPTPFSPMIDHRERDWSFSSFRRPRKFDDVRSSILPNLTLNVAYRVESQSKASDRLKLIRRTKSR